MRRGRPRDESWWKTNKLKGREKFEGGQGNERAREGWYLPFQAFFLADTLVMEKQVRYLRPHRWRMGTLVARSGEGSPKMVFCSFRIPFTTTNKKRGGVPTQQTIRTPVLHAFLAV